MKKLYFSHDSDARNSEKLLNLRLEMGAEGYGIYFMLIEKLFNENGYLELDYKKIKFDLRISDKKIQKVVEKFSLFEKNEEVFWSKSLLFRLGKINEKSQKARESAEKRWKQEKDKGMRTHKKNNASKEEKSKVKKNIYKHKYIPKDFYFAEKFWEFSGEKFSFARNLKPEEIDKTKKDWAEVFRKLREIDGVKENQIKYLLNWLFTDTGKDASFWRKNIQSPAKLRKKNREKMSYWRVLVLKIKENVENPAKNREISGIDD